MSSSPCTSDGPSRERFQSASILVGSFIKAPTVHGTQILGGIGFGFVVVDEEHQPLDRGDTELILPAARAACTTDMIILCNSGPPPSSSLPPNLHTPGRIENTRRVCRLEERRDSKITKRLPPQINEIDFRRHRRRNEMKRHTGMSCLPG
jgi:hypothetical protein